MPIGPDAPAAVRAAWLRESGVWAPLSQETLLAAAGAMRPARYASGEAIIRQGEPGRDLHVLIVGEADVWVHAAPGVIVPVGRMVPGACFGEMSLLSGDLTSADVVAATDCETLTLDRPSFEALVAREPALLREFVRMVSRRLRDSNVAMGAAREKEKGLTRFLQEAHAGQDGDLVGKQPVTRALQREIEEVARLDDAVLIQGERGTGKELAARLIHFRSGRRDGPLLATDCAQIQETPWGDKLFGGYREEGDGLAAAVSYLDLARGGSIVLKNVDALPRPLQDRLAEFLERQRRLPARTAEGVRVLATCSGDFLKMAGAGAASPALAAVLGARVLEVPPLRHRKRDVPELAAHFARKHAERLGKPAPVLDGQALSRLVTYDYAQGNVSELEEAIHRAVILTDGERIEHDAIFLGPPAAASRWAFNILSLARPDMRRVLRAALLALRVSVAAAVVWVLFEALRAPGSEGAGLATVLVWSLGWPLLVASFFFAGRACCAVCPMPLAADAGQRLLGSRWRMPPWIKRHDSDLSMAGFFAIIWVEQVTLMRQSPVATALLLLGIGAGAAITSILLPRRAWCRHLCPMGAFAGVGAMTGAVELRPTPDICAAKCQDHACYKGGSHAAGCPLFNHVMFLDSNRHCVLCLQCLDVCPNGSPQLNLRLPARDVLTAADLSTPARWTAMLGGVLVALAVLHQWERQAGGVLAGLLHEHRFLVVTAVLGLGAAIPLLALRGLARRTADRSAAGAQDQRWRLVAAWLPVVIAGFVAHQIAYVNWLSEVYLTLGSRVPGGPGGAAVGVTLLALVQGAALLSGLGVSAALAWNLRRRGTPNADRAAPAVSVRGLAVGLAYWAVLTLLILA